MKIEIKLVRNQAPANPRKKALMRVVALLALLALVLAIPASAKYVDSGGAVFSTELDSVAYKVTAPITLTGGDTIGLNTAASIAAAGSTLDRPATDTAVREAIDALTTWEPLQATSGTTAVPSILQLNRATGQVRARFASLQLTSGVIGQTLFTINYPSGFAPAGTRRAVIGIDMLPAVGRQTAAVEFNMDGTVYLCPHTPTMFSGTVPGLNGSTLFGDVIVFLRYD